MRRIHRVPHDPKDGLEGSNVANGSVAATTWDRLAAGVGQARHVLVLTEVDPEAKAEVVFAPALIGLFVERHDPVPLLVVRDLELAARAQNVDLNRRRLVVGSNPS